MKGLGSFQERSVRMTTTTGKRHGERRAGSRYPITVPLVYRLVRRERLIEVLPAETVNISSEGVLIRAAHPLPPGARIDLAIQWPGVQRRLKLFVAGRT